MKKISLNHGWLFAKGTITMMELFTGRGEKGEKKSKKWICRMTP